MGDGRTYEYVVGLRAVTSTDGMTADFYQFDMNFLGETATRIINEVKGVNRGVYDVTSKPPGTIEWGAKGTGSPESFGKNKIRETKAYGRPVAAHGASNRLLFAQRN